MNPEVIINVALVLFTGVLAWATVNLARHTKTLSDFTASLVQIEAKRDERDEREKVLTEKHIALQAAEKVQAIHRDNFASQLTGSSLFPEEEIQAIEQLHSLARHIDDLEVRLALGRLCNVFDTVRREKGTFKPNSQQITADMRTTQERIQCSVDKWRAEISSAD